MNLPELKAYFISMLTDDSFGVDDVLQNMHRVCEQIIAGDPKEDAHALASSFLYLNGPQSQIDAIELIDTFESICRDELLAV